MVTRISSFGQNQTLVNYMMNRQRDLANAQVQVSSGKVSQTYSGIARDSNALTDAKSAQAKLDGYLASSMELEQKLKLYDTSIGAIATIAEEARQDMIKAVNLNSGSGLFEKMRGHLEQLSSLLQTKDGDDFIFGGTREDTAPTSVGTVADLLALSASGDAFQNSQTKQRQNISDDRSMEYGVLADDVAGGLMNVLYRVHQFNAGTLPSGAGAYAPAGAFQDPLTDNQRDFLIAEFSNAVTALESVRTEEARNGVNLATLDRQTTLQTTQRNYAEIFVSDIEDVDLAEAVNRLNADQTALETTMAVLGRLNRNTLLNYL